MTVTPTAETIEVLRYGSEVGGLHRSAVLLAETLRAAGHPVVETVVPVEGPITLTAHAVDLRVACLNADQFYRVPVGPGAPLVGYWAWEVDRFRRGFARADRAVDAVWTISEYAAAAIRQAVHVPVQVFPLLWPQQDVPPPAPGFQVLIVADHASGVARKNAVGAVRAYLEAFPAAGEARLVIKTSGGEQHPGPQRRLKALASSRPDIDLIDGTLPRAEWERLLGGSHVHLSLHRAEGFGLVLVEAMASDVAVVATGHGGPLDFLTGQNSVLVPFRLVRVGVGHWPYPARSRWAQPDERAAARLLRRLYDDPALREGMTRRAREDVRLVGSPELVLPRVEELVRSVLAGGSRPRASAPPPPPGLARVLAGFLRRVDSLTTISPSRRKANEPRGR